MGVLEDKHDYETKNRNEKREKSAREIAAL
jgi:hypothetical protein